MAFAASNEAIALAIETRADLTGIKQARAGVSQLAQEAKAAATSNANAQSAVAVAVQQQTAATRVAAKAAASASASYVELNPKIKTAATSFALLSQAAITGQGSMAGLASAASAATDAIASQVKSVAKVAPAIGAAVALATVAVALYRQWTRNAREIAQHDYERSVSNARTVASQQRIVESMKQQREELLAQGGIMLAINEALEKVHLGWGQLHKLNERIFELGERIKDTRVAEAREARDRARSLKQGYDQQLQALSLETTMADIRAKSQDSLARQTYLRKLEVNAQLVDTEREINQRYELRDADGNIVALTKEQVRQREALVTQARAAASAARAQADAEAAITREEANRAARHRIAQGAEGKDDLQDRIAEINEERDAAIRAGEDRVLAEAEAQQKIRALQRARFKEAVTAYDQMSKAAILHGSAVAKVAAVAAKAIAVYEMIPQAKKDVQKGKSEFAAALADFAVPGKQPLGVAHMLASGAYFSAAAFGFAEAAGLGGGGGSAGSAGGGAASAGGGAGTFEPADRSDTGSVTVVLQMVDPTSKEVVNETIYQINRSGTLKRPINRPAGMATKTSSGGGGGTSVQVYTH